jgi:hypothetical protein
LEEPDLRMAAETNPRSFPANLADGCVLCEIQHLPHLLSYIKGIVDRDPKKAVFIPTGSHQPELHQSVSQSLAGTSRQNG